MPLRLTRALLAAAAMPVLLAHQQPATLMELDIGRTQVAMQLHVPLTELELAFGHAVSTDPEQSIGRWRAPFAAYLASHIRPETEAGVAWTMRVEEMHAGRAEQSQSGPFQEVVVRGVLTPPPGGDLRRFVLRYDAIMHQVVTHRAIVSIHSDWDAGVVEPVRIGTIAMNMATARIEPLTIRLGESTQGAGFLAMLRLGMQHIQEGTDHLLFLLVLLLPATLQVNGRQWGAFAGYSRSMTGLIRVVTAFTLGHSVTLLAGALHWLQLPSQPVELLIAFSVLVTAVHAIRPLFAGQEALVAAGFGLVHGLAFASVLAGMHLPGWPMALSIAGFNLGIELMQLFIIALTVPWLMLLSLTPAHRWVRVTGAGLASLAAAGWIAARATGQTNPIELLMASATGYAPLGILVLAAVAIPAYLQLAPWKESAAPMKGELIREH